MLTKVPASVPSAGSSIGFPGDATVLYELTERQIFVTSANGAVPAWDTYVISDGSGFEDTGPAIVDMIFHSEGENFAGNFQYQIRLEVKLLDGTWGNPPGGSLTVHGPFTSANYQISTTAFSDRSKIGVKSRLVLDVNNSAAATPVSGRLTIRVAVRHYCGN